MKERFYCFGANNTGNYVAIGGSSEFIYLYEIKNNGEINETLLKRPNKGKLNFLTFAFSHNTFVTGAEGKVNVCSLNNRKWKFVELDVIQHVEAAMRDKYQLNAAEWNRDDSYLFIMGNDKKIQIWKGTATNHVKTVEGHDKLAIFLQSHPKSRKYMFSSGRDGILKIWNVLAFNCVKTIHAFEDEKAIYDANISPDGKTIAIGGDRTVSVFSVGI
uniref:Uncharacterized protein n=1 Tax=Panagrolaimus sp. ES5 TaxID=591445 RepID=A0AC34FUA5_9BILA